MRRALRWLLCGIALVVLLVALARRLDLEVPFVAAPLRDAAIRLLAGLTDAQVDVGAARATFGQRLVVDDVRIRVRGRTVARIPRVEIVYAVLPALRGRLELARVAVDRPWVRAVRLRGGWELPAPRSGGEGGGSQFGLAIATLAIDGGRIEIALADVAPARRFGVTGLALRAAVRLGPDEAAVRVDSLAAVPRGVALEPVTASGSVARGRDGVLRLASVALDSRRSRLTARGELDPGRSVDAMLTLAPLAAADVRAVLPETGVRADVRAAARARGPWRAIAATARARLSPGGRLAARAGIDATGPRKPFSGHVRFARLDPGAVVTGLPAASLDGRLAIGGTDLDPHATLAYRALLRQSRVAATEVERFELAGGGRAGVHRVWALAVLPAGRGELRSRIALRTPVAYRAALRYDVPHLERMVEGLSGQLTGRARLAGRGTDAHDRHASAELVATGSVRGRSLRRAELRAELAGDDLRLARASVDADRFHADGRGTFDLARREARASIAVDGDLAAVHPALGGTVAATGSAHGPLRDLTAAATATIDGGKVGDLAARQTRLWLSARGLGGASATAAVHLDASDARFRAGSIYEARGDVEWRRAELEDRLRLVLDAHAADGGVQAAELALVRTPARTTGELRTLTMTPPEGAVWRLAAPATFTVDDAFATRDLTLVSGAQRISLAGRIGLRGASSARLRLEHVALAPACALAGGPACSGALSGSVSLAGTAAAPLLDIAARAEPVHVRDVDYAVVLAVHYADAAARIDATVRQATAGTLTASGTVPVDLAWEGTRRDLHDAPVALGVRADGLDLAFLALMLPRTVREARGTLDVDLRIGGPRAAPRPTGTAAVSAGAIQLAATGITYDEIRVHATADGSRVTLSELHARTGDGTLDGHGSVEVRSGGVIPLDGALQLDHFFAIRQHAYEATLSGGVSVRGTLDAPDVSGAVDVDRAVVRPAALPGTGLTIRPDPTISVLGEEAEITPPDETPGGALGEALRLSVRVRIANDAWIRRNDANIELGGDLVVSKAPAEAVRVNGQIQLLRGWYEFQGRRFDIEPGSTITFTGAAPPDPVFDVTAVRATHDYRIQVKLTGSAEKPKLDLSSDPPLEKADILSVLLFGKPASELGRGQSVALQQQALQLAAGYAMPELRASVMNALGLDTLEVQMPETAEPGRVSAGRYVAEDVFVSLGQEFGTRNAQVVGVEYSLGRSVSIKASTSTRGTSAIDLFWRYRY